MAKLPSTSTQSVAAARRRPPHTRRKPVARTKKELVASSLYNLTLDIHDLKQQIHQLCLRRAMLLQPRALLRSQSDFDGSSAKKVEKLFSVFNRGYRVHDGTPQAYMASLTGDDMLFDVWRNHTVVFASNRCELRVVRVVFTKEQEDADETTDEDVENATACVVRVEAVSHGAFTRTSLEAYYPAVLDDPDLTQTLVGHVMAKPMVFQFEFNAKGRVVRFHIEPDLFTALAQALEDPIRAATILNMTEAFANVGLDERHEAPTASLCHQVDNQDEQQVDHDDPVEQARDPRHAVAFLLS